jgi:glutaminyl-tRNA synthetase
MFDNACGLIKKGLAYVCELTQEEVKANRGDTSKAAVCPYRDRPIAESLDLFMRMKNGEFPDGKMTLRAKIDINSGNFNMRDPVIYRINHSVHHRTGDKWCIYPMYDYAHPIEDAVEKITHSLCTLEFEDHRPMYEWVVNNMNVDLKPRQIEFARLNIDHTVMSKRKLRRLVDEKYVSGWDDPRLPTISGLRRRGYTSAAIRNFCAKIGVSKVNSTVEYEFLEHCLREDLNLKAKRVMAVLDPIKLTVTNYPDGKTEEFEIENNPNDENSGKRKISFSKEIYIESEDFMEEPPKKYFRLFPGNEVRLKSAYVVKCTGCRKDDTGKITEVYCEYDPDSRGGNTTDGRKIKGTIHWVDSKTSVNARVNLYDNLFLTSDPESEGDFIKVLNKNSLRVMSNCKIEKSLALAPIGEGYQFMRMGYFCLDKESTRESLIFNRSVGLKDSFKPKG